jgi:hypothetical protein
LASKAGDDRDTSLTLSEQNVETVRRWIEQFAHATTPEAASVAVNEYWDADADYYPVRKFPDAQPRHGLAPIAAFIGAWRDAWDAFEFGAVTIIPIDDVRVFVHTSVLAHGHETQAPVDTDLYHSIWLRNGLILRCEDHLTEAGARRGLGLR